MKKIFSFILFVLISFSFSCSFFQREQIVFFVDEEEYATVEIVDNDFELPNDPEKSGYEFIGWFFDEDTWDDQLTESDVLNPEANQKFEVYAYFKRVYSQSEVLSML